MKHLLFLLLLIPFQSIAQVVDSVWSPDVKSVYLAPVGNEMGSPIIRLTDDGSVPEPLLLRFDILQSNPSTLRYRFRHCDAFWHVDSLEVGEFFSGNNEAGIDNYESSFTTLKDYICYYKQFPEPYGRFMASGNYILEVFPAEHPDSLLLTRKFYVCEDVVETEITIGKPSGSFGNFNRDQEVNVSVTPRRGSFLPSQPEYYQVMVKQNGRDDLLRVLEIDGYSGDAMLYAHKKANVFAGGNCFRYFDLSNLRATMYHIQRIERVGDDVFAFLQPDEDRSRKAYVQYNSLNGGMKTNIRDRQNPHIESDYVWVNFSLPMERPFMDGNIYIVGDLTMWRLNENSRMEWNPRFKAYTKRMLLKQGYYSYQLVFLPIGENEGLTSKLEGDHNVTVNEYTVYVYYRSPGARFDRLVALRKASSNQ